MISMMDLLNEDEAGGQTPSQQAKALGLVYGGFGGWIDVETRVVKAKTINGKLVRVDDDEDGASGDDLGRLAILNFDPGILQSKADTLPPEKVKAYNQLLTKILQFGGDFVVFTARAQELEVAKYLKSIGITAGVKLAPLGSSDSQKKRKYVEKKIKAGYKHIQYFDYNSKDIAAIESLKAPYNKLDVRIETFDIPTLSGEPNDTKR